MKTLKSEDDSSDVDDPSEVELSDKSEESEEESPLETSGGGVQKKVESQGYENNNDAEESESEIPKAKSKTNVSSPDEGPPLKKIKLSPNKVPKPNQKVNCIELEESHNEKQNEDETDFEWNHENINANFFSEELTCDDEIFTFQCPKNFDIKSLLNKELDLSKGTKLKDDNNKYVCHGIQNIRRKKIDCVFPSREKGAVILKLPVVGHIVLRQKLKLSKRDIGSDEDCAAGNAEIPISDSMKRHPLLGTKWNDHIDKVSKQMRKHKKLLRKSLKHEKSLEKSEKERKEQKKKLKVELALLKKKTNFGH